MASVKLSPPFKTPVLESGFFSRAWEFFFRDLVNRQEIIVDKFLIDLNASDKEFQLSVEPLNINYVFPSVNGVGIPHFSWDADNSEWVPNYWLKREFGDRGRMNIIEFRTAPAAGVLEVVTHGR